MDYIIVRSHTDTGKRLPDVRIPLGRSETAVRIMKRIARMAKGGGTPDMDGDTLGNLDSGRISFAVLAKLFQRSELERAVKIRLADVDIGPDERDMLLSLLKVGRRAWSASMGGERASDRFGIDRYAAPRGSRRDTFGGGGSRGDGGDPEAHSKVRRGAVSDVDPMRKSQAGAMCGEVAKAHMWRVTKSTAEGGLEYHHAKHGGHSLTISPDGDWQHSGRGGKKIESGGAGQLAGYLGKLHHHDD